jgi:AmmeMemoRadiSam system protein B/AmmeMemoRadiSam system protein A
MNRAPVVAGQFYPGGAAQLRKMLKAMVPDAAEKLDAVGLVVPHAGYAYSGPVVGAVLSRVNLKATCVILCPNHSGMGKLFSVWPEGLWKTPLGEVEVDSELAGRLLANSRYLESDTAAHLTEHAIEVQLPFLQYLKPDIKIVPIVLAPGNGETYKEIGREIALAIQALKRETIVMASSDMTHYEAHEVARKKDAQAVQAMLELNGDELLRRVARFDITMCGYGPAVAMLAAARELGAGSAELIKYMTSGDTVGDLSSVVGYAGIAVWPMSPLARLAQQTVETYVTEGRVAMPDHLTPEMEDRAGVFVSLHKHGALRGCIGTFEPQSKNVAEEVVANAVSSATRDPRFSPVRKSELKDLEYSVDVLTPPVPVEDKERLDPKKFGVIVQCGRRKGLLLPDLEGVDTVEQQIDICRQKAGIAPDEQTDLYCFEVKRYK